MHLTKRPQFRRLIAIDSALRQLSYPTANDLARTVEVNPKTIRRDLDYLRDQLGAPVEFSREHNGWHYTESTFKLPSLILTEGELLAMFVAGSLLSEHRGTPYHQSLKSALARLADLLPDQISISWETIEQAHSARNSVASRQDLDLFRRLADAVLHHHQIRIVYWSAGRDEVTERVVDPWHLTCVDGDWYVIGWCHLRDERRMFAPSRIRKLESTGEDFTVPNDFHAADFFSGTFRVVQDARLSLRTIRLQFAPSAAKYVREKIWNESQTLSPTADGGVILELKLHSLVEIRRWVLSWGSECRVLEPTELRDDILSEARQMISSAQGHAAPPANRRKARQLPK